MGLDIDIYTFYGAELPLSLTKDLLLKMHMHKNPNDRPDEDEDLYNDIVTFGVMYDESNLKRWIRETYSMDVSFLYTSVNDYKNNKNIEHLYLIVGDLEKVYEHRGLLNPSNVQLHPPTNEQITHAKEFLELMGVNSEILPTTTISIS